MATVQFTLATGIDIVHVPFRGSAPALTAIVGNQVDMLFETVRADSIAFVQDGKVRALGIAAKARSTALPDVPTMAEAGIPGVQSGFWVALFAPAKTPAKVIQYLNKEAVEIFKLKDVRSRFEQQNVVLSTGSPDDLKKYEDEEIARWGDVLRRTNLKFPG
jgi:tripartite-type tricarboxylate transporter receptor subunit TctC